jgi:hypothetical protein
MEFVTATSRVGNEFNSHSGRMIKRLDGNASQAPGQQLKQLADGPYPFVLVSELVGFPARARHQKFLKSRAAKLERITEISIASPVHVILVHRELTNSRSSARGSHELVCSSSGYITESPQAPSASRVSLAYTR